MQNYSLNEPKCKRWDIVCIKTVTYAKIYFSDHSKYKTVERFLRTIPTVDFAIDLKI